MLGETQASLWVTRFGQPCVGHGWVYATACWRAMQQAVPMDQPSDEVMVERWADSLVGHWVHNLEMSWDVTKVAKKAM